MAAEPLPKILIIDDEENYLNSLRRILQATFTVTTTRDPLQALKLVEHHGPFTVIISDFRMPVMNGIELFSRILALDHEAQRILITGHAELQMTIDAINHGKINAFLTKPTPASAIRSVVLSALHAYQKQKETKNLPVNNSQQTAAPTLEKDAPNILLTVKEKEILQLVARGHSNAEIAQELHITVGTVKTHLNNLFSKFAVSNRSKLAALGTEFGFIK
ncbi:MAG: response regulator transcription factor [Sporomusaceae bacterium]|nr:response regulator transcription factor [Sporomusaceae bacterium]